MQVKIFKLMLDKHWEDDEFQVALNAIKDEVCAFIENLY